MTLLELTHHSDPDVQLLSIDLLLELFLFVDLDQVTIIQDSAREYGALLYMVYFALKVGFCCKLYIYIII